MTQLYTYSTGWLKGKNNSTGDYKFTATIDLNSQDQLTNTSNITATLTLVADTNSGALMWNAPRSEANRPYGMLTGDISATGTRIIRYNKSTTPLTIVTWTGNVAHDEDGTKTLSVSFKWVDGALEYYPAAFTISTASIALPDIQRYGHMEVPDTIIVTSGSNTHAFTAYSDFGSYPYHFKRTIGGNSTTTITTIINKGTRGTWSLYDSLYLDWMPNTKTATMTVELMVNDGGWKTIQTKSVTVIIDTTVIKPSVTVDTITINSTPITGKIVAGYTTLDVGYTTTASDGTGVTLTNTFSSVGGTVTFTPSSSSTIGSGTTTTSAVPSNSAGYRLAVKVTCVDSRGATASASMAVNVEGYSPPLITADAYRCTSGGTRDDVNSYTKCVWTVSYTTITGNFLTNSATYNGNAYTNGTVQALAENNIGTFVITATDNCTTVTKTLKVNRATVPLDLYDDGSQHYGMATCGPIAEPYKVKLGNSTITEVNMMASALQFFTGGEIVAYESANSTDANNLFPSNNLGIKMFSATSSSGRSNWPTTRARAVIVALRLTASYGMQLCWGNTDNIIYQRVYNNGTWAAWKSVTFS